MDAGERASEHVKILGIQPGDILAEKYQVERVLGSGGMGVVVAARHIHLDERVAIKFLRPEALMNAEAVARFNQEARVAVKIKSEHVARVIDVGQLANGAPYLVMEYLEGLDLSQWLKDYGPLEISQAVEFIVHACEALAEAHAAGIVHRDLKPANLFTVREADGLLSAKVLDFGISKLSTMGSINAPAMTGTHAVLGSPQYMSPEQMHSSKTVDSRTDIWSLGIILYELLAGFAPFNAETMPELVLAIVRDPLPPLRQSRQGLPWGLDRAVTRALEKDRGMRFQTVADFVVALREFAPPNALPIIERTVRIVEASGARVSRASMVSIPPPVASAIEEFGTGNTEMTERNPQMVGTISNWGQNEVDERAQRAEKRRRRVIRAVALSVLGGVMAGVLGVFAWQYSAHRGEVAGHGPAFVQPTPMPTPTAPSALPPVGSSMQGTSMPGSLALSGSGLGSANGVTSATPLSPPPSDVADASASSAPARPAGDKHPPPAAGNGGKRHPPAASGKPPAAEAPTCTPPYVIDGDGHKQYKPECI